MTGATCTSPTVISLLDRHDITQLRCLHSGAGTFQRARQTNTAGSTRRTRRDRHRKGRFADHSENYSMLYIYFAIEHFCKRFFEKNKHVFLQSNDI